jgi:hypothetical protein
MNQELEIFVLPTLTVISDIFAKVEKFADQDKIPVPEDVEQFFYLKNSIISFLVYSNGLVHKSIRAPMELKSNISELEKMQTKYSPNTYVDLFKVRTLPGRSPSVA